MLPDLPDFYVDDIVKRALAEDINYIDVTTDQLFPNDQSNLAHIAAKEDGVLAGIGVAIRVFRLINSDVSLREGTTRIEDGQPIKRGRVIAEIKGNTRAILKAERTALNFLQHMSGIATYTRRCVDAVSGTKAKIADTRKTVPGLRALQKYAVLCGGGSNHRFNLSSAAMIKDNHIDFYGSISEAVKALRAHSGHMVAAEVEVRDLPGLKEALESGADVVLLDNMNVDAMKEAVEIRAKIAPKCSLEASGNITLENIREVAETGVDVISIGALTHSVRALDISLTLV